MIGMKVSQWSRQCSPTAAAVAAQLGSSSSRPTPATDDPATSIMLLPVFALPYTFTPKDLRPVSFNSGAANAADNRVMPRVRIGAGPGDVALPASQVALWLPPAPRRVEELTRRQKLPSALLRVDCPVRCHEPGVVREPPGGRRKVKQPRRLRVYRLLDLQLQILDARRQVRVVLAEPRSDLLGIVGHLALHEQPIATAADLREAKDLEGLAGSFVLDVRTMTQLCI